MGMLEEVIAELREEEGWRSLAYLDTKNNVTIGFGYNLGNISSRNGRLFLSPANGISEVVGEQLLLGKALEAFTALREQFPWVVDLDVVRQKVLVNMAYNMGPRALQRWPIFMGQIERGEYGAAARNMRRTPWCRDVGCSEGQRGWRLSEMMRTGKNVKLGK